MVHQTNIKHLSLLTLLSSSVGLGMIQNELIYFYRLPACHAGCPCSADIIKDARKRPWEEVVTTTPPLKSENRVSTSFIEAQDNENADTRTGVHGVETEAEKKKECGE